MSVHRSEHRIGLDGIEEIRIFNPVGRVDVTGWAESEVFLDYTVTLPGDPESSETLIPQIETSENILIIQPAKGILGRKQNTGSVDSEDSQKCIDWEDSSEGLSAFLKKIFSITGSPSKKFRAGVKVSMNIRVPRSISIRVKNYNGAIAVSDMDSSLHIKGLNGPISLDSVNGSIDAQTLNGPVMLVKSKPLDVSLRTLNGPIKCYLEALLGPAAIKTVNGPVRVTLPYNAKADLSVKTLFGPIKIGSEFSSQHRTTRSVGAVLNSAEFPVTIKTTTGPIMVGVTDLAQESAENVGHKDADPMPLNANSELCSDGSASLVEQKGEKSVFQNGSQSETLCAQIDRMLAAGKISADEAERLRKTI